MLSFAAIAMAAASAATTPALTTPALTSNTPWWEKITVTYDGNGSHRACDYETSLAYVLTQEACDMRSAQTETAKAAASNAGVQTKITFERRFTPGAPPELDALQPGDTLIGGLMMLVAISEDGSVRACSVIAESGEDKPSYGCEQVRAERFQASLGSAQKDSRVGFLTVLVYGHEEEVV